jgi:hypothetical protein
MSAKFWAHLIAGFSAKPSLIVAGRDLQSQRNARAYVEAVANPKRRAEINRRDSCAGAWDYRDRASSIEPCVAVERATRPIQDVDPIQFCDAAREEMETATNTDVRR